ncbi:aldo/keto reductase [Isachenkonia alkalipeptolytica]|uniref:Aldo/keto reductase n=1 Tax=Isachenkonia alkalipeptolytica TaxID=2565777 RepID=A0AA43XK03_9CLOT|nr:aldo/keto reductase [Isachenkonia alkalipeptolytica]NBG87305.1 aldo/keto reductase [Isachenkonia alkalipeptolytica]
MEKRMLGKWEFGGSVIGFGGIPIQRISDEEGIEVVKTCLESGINFIDTARGYGKSEEVIGKAIAGNRDQWVLATKSMARDYQGMKKDIETSLNNLQTHCIDLYQLHNVRKMEEYEEIMSEKGAYKALKEAKEAGKIKAIGFTGHDVDMAERAVDSKKFASIQFPYNIVESQGEKVFEKAKKQGIGVIVMKPLAGGAIEDGSLALKYILNNPNISVIIPGMDSIAQVKENAAVSLKDYGLTGQEQEKIEEIQGKLGNRFCRRCGYCAPCAVGINIPAQFLMEGYYSRYNLKEWAKTRYDALDKKASDCIKCGDCEPRCPYDLPIREMLEEVEEVMEQA